MRHRPTLLLLLLPFITLAQPGTVDPNFGISGYVTPEGYFNDEEYGYAVAIRPDGKILVIGRRAASYQIACLFTADGWLDNSYGIDGFALGQFSLLTNDAILMDDGRFVVAGQWGLTDPPIAAARRLPDGSADTTYGTNGWTEVVASPDGARVEACAMDDDDNLYITGYAGNLGNADLFVLKLDSTGTPDPTFGTNGLVVSSFADVDIGYDILVDDQGRVVVVGVVYDGDRYLAMWRFLPDGTPDATFGTNGELRVKGAAQASTGALALDAAGNYVGAGKLNTFSGDSIHTFRVTPAGTLDPTFANNGLLATQIGIGEEVTDMLVMDDGRILVCGHSSLPGVNRQFLVLRLQADGTPDAAFGTDGVALAGFNSSSSADVCRAMALDAQGGIILAGSYPASSFDEIMVTRLFGDGSVDLGYGAEPEPIQVYPNPAPDGRVSVTLPNGQVPDRVLLLDAAGREVPVRTERTANTFTLELPNTSGSYTLSAFRDGRHWVASVVR